MTRILLPILLALLALTSASTPAQDAPTDLKTATLKPLEIVSPPPEFYRNPKNIVYQTGAAVAVSPGGRIWVAIMTGGADECEENYVDLLTSGDGGKTWSGPKFALDMPGPMRTFDPAAWTDPDGRVWIFWSQVYSTWDGRGGLWATVCDDPDNEDAHWSAPRRLCDGVMKDKPLVKKNGEWLFFVEQWQDDCQEWFWNSLKKKPLPEWYCKVDHIGANVFKTTDKGATFEYLSAPKIPSDVRTCDEHMAIEHEDGSLTMLLRVKYGMGESHSKDGGKTWTDVEPSEIKNPPARFFFAKLKSGNVLLVKNGPIDKQTDRRDLTAYLSEDDGKTFPYKLLLDGREGVAYPDCSQTEDGTIYCVHDFDRRNQGEIILDVFTEEDVKAGEIVSKQGILHQMVRCNVQHK